MPQAIDPPPSIPTSLQRSWLVSPPKCWAVLLLLRVCAQA